MPLLTLLTLGPQGKGWDAKLVHASRILWACSVFQAPTFSSSSDNQLIVSTG